MMANPANSKIVRSSSEVALRDLLEGQPADLIEEMAMDLRTRVSLGWAGPDPSRALLVVHRKNQDGSVVVELTRDLLAAGTLHWDPNCLAFVVTRPGDPSEYTIPGGEDELPEVMDHPSVPTAARERLCDYLSRSAIRSDACDQILAKAWAVIGLTARDRATTRKFAAAALVLPRTWELTADDGKKIRVTSADERGLCSIELAPPLPAGSDRSEFSLKLGGRMIKPISWIGNRFFRVRYSDISDILSHGTE